MLAPPKLRYGVERFTTDRLTAEPLTQDHLEPVCRMHRDARVMSTLGGLRTTEETETFLKANARHWRRRGYGLWAFNDALLGQFVGRGGLRHVIVAGQHEIELAYAFTAEAWGQGLATEAAAGVLKLAYDHIGLSDIVCYTLPDNKGSRRVMEKIGFAYEKDITHVGLLHVLYRITPAHFLKFDVSQLVFD